jgi:hypothetical protein
MTDPKLAEGSMPAWAGSTDLICKSRHLHPMQKDATLAKLNYSLGSCTPDGCHSAS